MSVKKEAHPRLPPVCLGRVVGMEVSEMIRASSRDPLDVRPIKPIMVADKPVNHGGVFAQRAHSANYYRDYPGNNPENHAPAESCTINSKLKNSNI